MFHQPHTSNRYLFEIEDTNQICAIELVESPDNIAQDRSRDVLVESFVSEYERTLKPQDIRKDVATWRDGETSAVKFYQDYFASEYREFAEGRLHFWVQAKIHGNVVGWATFEREKSDPSAVYMNLLAVDPQFQRMGIGSHLVMSLLKLGVIENLSAIHLLIRKANAGGNQFYSKLGFFVDPDFQRPDNFVDINLLQGLTWRNPAPKLTAKAGA